MFRTSTITTLCAFLFLFIGCNANTIEDPDQSGSGTVFAPNANPNILIRDGRGDDSINIPDVGEVDNKDFARLIEVQRGQIGIFSGVNSVFSGTVSLYEGLDNNNTVEGRGIHLQGDTAINTEAYQVRAYTFDRRLSESDSVSVGVVETNGLLLNSLGRSIRPDSIQVQGDDQRDIESLVFICDFDGSSEVCAFVNLDSNNEKLGNTSFRAIAHGASGGFRFFRNPETYNLIFETETSYRGDDGPNLFFYLSEVEASGSISGGDRRFVARDSSIIIDPENPLNRNSGRISREIPGSALTELSRFKTVALWCEAFSVLFQVADIRDI